MASNEKDDQHESASPCHEGSHSQVIIIFSCHLQRQLLELVHLDYLRLGKRRTETRATRWSGIQSWPIITDQIHDSSGSLRSH